MKDSNPIPLLPDNREKRRMAITSRLLEALEKDPWHPKRDVQTLARVLASILAEHEARQDALEARLPEHFVACQPPERCSGCGSAVFESYQYCDKKNCSDHPTHEISVLNFRCHCGALTQIPAQTAR